MRFEDIPGHSDIKEYLISAHRNNRIAHAQLFSGIPGSANFPLALAFATYILCKNKSDQDACGECENCKRINKLIYPDIHFFYPKPTAKPKDYDKAFSDSLKKWRELATQNFFPELGDWISINGFESKNLLISKEDSKQIIKTVSMKSFEGDFKIIFIWYPEFMNPSSANAILKVLEEPPTNTIYFLVTYAYENLLTTITSRTQLISVPPFRDEEIESYLVEKKEVPQEKARKVAHLANGSMSKAFQELESVGEIAYQEFQEWMRCCFKRNYAELAKQSEGFGQRSRSDQRNQLEYGLALVRESLRSTSNDANGGHNEEEMKFISNFGSANSLESMEQIHLLLSNAISNLERNANPRITYMNLSLSFCNLFRRR
ncbi:MAG: DNA polymerase III subunit delta [Cyclobacteriaceae bacterium]